MEKWDENHIFNTLLPGEVYRQSASWHRENFEIFQLMVHEEFSDMRLYLGNEVYYQVEAPDKLLVGDIMTLNDSGYVLLEFSIVSRRSQVISGVSEILGCGFTPIIAHAERHEIFRTDERLTDEVLQMGALIQLNADSVMGKHGVQVKNFCHKLLKAEKAHFIASDAHDDQIRPPLLRECFLWIHKKYGQVYAARVFYENAQAIIENRRI